MILYAAIVASVTLLVCVVILVWAYLKGRKWQMIRLDKEVALLERIAVALEHEKS